MEIIQKRLEYSRFSAFWAQFAWAIYLISLVVYSLMFLIEIFAGGSPGIFDLPVRIYIQDYTELIANSEAEKIFQDPILETEFNTIGGSRRQLELLLCGCNDLYEEQKLTV